MNITDLAVSNLQGAYFPRSAAKPIPLSGLSPDRSPDIGRFLKYSLRSVLSQLSVVFLIGNMTSSHRYVDIVESPKFITLVLSRK
jgi:hypothetical protein